VEPIREVVTHEYPDGGYITTMEIEEHEIFVYQGKDTMHSDVINYGFSAPTLLVLGDSAFSRDEAAEYAKESGLSDIAGENGGSVIFLNPQKGKGWDTEPYGLYEKVMGKLKLTQWGFDHGIVYDDKIPKNFFEEMMRKEHPLEDETPEYFILGSSVAVYVFAKGKGADYIGRFYLKHVEGSTYLGDLGEGDLTITAALLEKMNEAPIITSKEIHLVSVGNEEIINSVFLSSGAVVSVYKELDIREQYDGCMGDYKRWKNRVMKADNWRKEGIVMEPETLVVTTCEDNHAKGIKRPEHTVGIVNFYGKNMDVHDEKNKKPLMLCFHGGGDSAVATAMIGGWPEIAKENGFIVSAVEMHLDVPSTEVMEVLEHLKKEFAIDETKIYATGFSMGGIKSWDLYQEYPKAFAGLAPMNATVDVGENAQFEKVGEVNREVMVPVFYNAGEESPLAELPRQEEKCFNRIKYLFEVNKVKKAYDVKFEDKESWKDQCYGVGGDITRQFDDKDYPECITTVRYYESEDGEIYTALSSVSHHKHDIRPNTCRIAWDFLRKFRRTTDGKIVIEK
jgi:dienelactone hydrolase